ncbi:MAG: FG-GAP repeat protein [Planctomycetes bacterium]|nr:FG-GAP repeat protein [Planctomycetota bacterium]
MTVIRSLVLLTPLAFLASPVAAQCTVQKLVDPIGGFAEHFGDRFVLAGDELFAGAPNHDGPFGVQQGAVLRWVRSGGTWTLTETIHANQNTSNTQFGWGVALAGDHLLVGAYADNDAGTIAGAVHAFERGPSGFVYHQKLVGSSASAFEYAGYAVAADRDWVVIGATDLGDAFDLGKVWVFRFENGAWIEKQELAPGDPTVARHFGEAVDIDDDRIVVGAPASAPSGELWTGAAYVFEFVGGVWTQTAQLGAQDPESFDGFARSVALDGDRILCGATGNDENGVQSGSVYVFDYAGGAWQQSTKLVASDAQQGDLFGASVGLQGDLAVIGAPWDDDGAMTAGAGYLFVKGTGGWEQSARFTAPDPQADHQFGHWVALDGGTVALSAVRDATWGIQSGADYVFEIGGEATNTCVSEPNSTGVAAEITYTGSLSTGANTFTLHAQNLPPNKQGVFFYGPVSAQVPFGNGWACVLGGSIGVFRLNPSAPADTNGHLSRHVDFTVAPAGSGPGTIAPGSTWYFQCWYRDPGVGAGYDLTDGLRVVFCP